MPSEPRASRQRRRLSWKETVQNLFMLLFGCFMLAFCFITGLITTHALAFSLAISCRYPECFPPEVANDAMIWCKRKQWTSPKLNFATALFHTWPATVNDIHRAANYVLPAAIAQIIDSELYATTFYLALIRPVFEFFGLFCVHLIRESMALVEIVIPMLTHSGE